MSSQQWDGPICASEAGAQEWAAEAREKYRTCVTVERRTTAGKVGAYWVAVVLGDGQVARWAGK